MTLFRDYMISLLSTVQKEMPRNRYIAIFWLCDNDMYPVQRHDRYKQGCQYNKLRNPCIATASQGRTLNWLHGPQHRLTTAFIPLISGGTSANCRVFLCFSCRW